jgi:Cupin domain
LDWHSHPGGQVLLITEGAGYYQERGKPARVVRKGDVIKCAPGVEHWHGATPNSGFAYLAVTPTQKGKTIWLEPVSYKDYNQREIDFRCGVPEASDTIFQPTTQPTLRVVLYDLRCVWQSPRVL